MDTSQDDFRSAPPPSSGSPDAREDKGNQINNMLTAILGYAEMVRLGASIPTEVVFYADRIREATERLSLLLRSLPPDKPIPPSVRLPRE